MDFFVKRVFKTTPYMAIGPTSTEDEFKREMEIFDPNIVVNFSNENDNRQSQSVCFEKFHWKVFLHPESENPRAKSLSQLGLLEPSFTNGPAAQAYANMLCFQAGTFNLQGEPDIMPLVKVLVGDNSTNQN